MTRIAALILAAGRSSRMGGANKLLATFSGVPLVRRTASTALASRASSVTIVVGHQAAAVREALDGLAIETVLNADFSQGLSTSLRSGFEQAARQADGVLVMLADQPALLPAHLDALIASFRPQGRGSIVVATDGGRRANPVILPSVFRDDIASIVGDKGARDLIVANEALVQEVEIGAEASLDVDTPDLLARAGGVPAGLAPSGRS